MIAEELSILIKEAEEASENLDFMLSESLGKQALHRIQRLREEGAADDFERHEMAVSVVLAQSRTRQDDLQAAQFYCDRALFLSRKYVDQNFEMSALLAQGYVHYSQNLSDAIMQTAETVIQMANQLGNKSVLIRALVLKSGGQKLGGKVVDGLADLNQALELARGLEDIRLIADVLLQLSKTHRVLGDSALALECIMECLQYAQSLSGAGLTAQVLYHLGVLYWSMNDYAQCAETFLKTLAVYVELEDKKGEAGVLVWLGSICLHYGDYGTAFNHLFKSLAIAQEIGSRYSEAYALTNIAIVHNRTGEIEQQIQCCRRAEDILRETGPKDEEAGALISLASALFETNRVESLECIERAISIAEKSGAKHVQARGLAVMASFLLEEHKYSAVQLYCKELLLLSEEIGSISFKAHAYLIQALVYSDAKYSSRDLDKALECFRESLSIAEATSNKELCIGIYQHLAKLYDERADSTQALYYLKKFNFEKEELKLEETTKQVANQQSRQKLAELEKERLLSTQRENILNNILPADITRRLIQGENPIADSFESVSILFLDIVNFTPIAERVPADQLVYLLNSIFRACDAVMTRFGCEKIKTIGDSYMAVCGAPIVVPGHALKIAQASVALIDVMRELDVIIPRELGDRSWMSDIDSLDVRIGLHCGPVTAGVIGDQKFLYDLWGDAVNIAARMESYGEAGKIHVSEKFKLAVESDSQGSPNSLHFISRGEIQVKGKGNMRTYFLENVH